MNKKITSFSLINEKHIEIVQINNFGIVVSKAPEQFKEKQFM